MKLVKFISFLLLCFALVAFTGGGWEEDVRAMAGRHCRLLEAELKCKQQPGDTTLQAAYDQLYQEMLVLSDQMEKKYKQKHKVNEKALKMYNAEMEKCQAQKDLAVWEEKMLKKAEDDYQRVKQGTSPLIDKSDSLLHKIRKE